MQHGSSRTPPSRYETPPELNSRPFTAAKRAREVYEGNEQESEDDDKYPAKQRDRPNRRQDCDNWPPTEVDHYSPPRRERGTVSPIPARPDYIHSSTRLSQPVHNRSDDASNRPRQRSWQERLAADGLNTSRQFQVGRFELRRGNRQPLEYGRLSPPSTRESTHRPTSHDGSNGKPPESHYELDSTKLRSPQYCNGPSSSSPAPNRLAFRQEVYDALQGHDDNFWYLASVNGHQVKEEEL